MSRSFFFKLALSVAMAAVMIGLVVHYTDFGSMIGAFHDASLAPIAPAMALVIAGQLLRTVRWWLLVRAIDGKISLSRILPTALAGFLAINVFPLRTGEAVRPLLLSRRDGIPFAGGLGTVLAERVADVLAVFLMLLATLLVVPATSISIGGRGYDLRVVTRVLLAVFVTAGFFLAALLVFRMKLVALVARALAWWPKAEALGTKVLATFVMGLESFSRLRSAAQIGALTAAIWATQILVMRLGFSMFHLDLGMGAAVAALAITMAGITLPAGIGMSGNFQIFCVAALALYQVDPATALACSIAVNAMMFAGAVVMGLAALPFLGVSMSPVPDGG